MERRILRPAGSTRNPVLSPAAVFGNLVFTSGTVALDPDTGQLAGDDIRSQTRQTMENLRSLVEAAGTSLDHALKVTAYVADLEEDRDGFNEVYAEFFEGTPPPRTCTQAGKLGKGVLVEVEVIAGIPE